MKIVEQIPEALAGERLDRVVALVTGLSRAAVGELIAAGAVTLDGTVATAGKVRLALGQIVGVDQQVQPADDNPLPDPSVEVEVVHADDDLLIVDKPAGLVVHPGAGHESGTLVNGLLHRFPEVATVGQAGRPGIVHRLDAGTSGLMAVARSERAYRALVAMLAAHDVGRVYRALVWGHPENRLGIVEAPIGRDRRDPLRMAVTVDGKPARTHYLVVAEFDDPVTVAELRCELETGRTHQIRVHLAAIGHPVVGDVTYGGVRPGLEPGRPFLHAAELRLIHPVSGQPLSFTSPLPADLQAVLDGLSG